MIEVRKLSKWYQVHEREPGFIASLKSLYHRKFRTVKAVDDVSFYIPEGEIVAFLGPNGAGKTTTMKVLTGLLHPSGGEVNVGGFVPFQHKKEFKKQISLVMGQKSQLIWDLPAAETFLVNKVIYEIPDQAYEETLADLVHLLQLEEVIRKPVRQLSLGERMKCELAAALLHRPRIVFLDEPTIGLDVNMQEVMRRFIQDYSRKYKATILLTSHYMADVTALCERVLVIGKGRLLYDGAINQLVERYAPNKRIRLQLAKRTQEHELEDVIDGMGTLVHYAFPNVDVDVPRDQVSELSARLLSKLSVLDLTIEDPSMESVIAQAFEAKTEGGSIGS
ncbi:ABC transporter ATP-binding protein [Paenibacillus aceris]|uniref:ABC-2 type transport system ATP-binding protein n=1 Tax=Paenibacillus aceris TaxID=869555 RepID=A0ABS4HXN9_9BACL|nr:ATP-binding cassette domain-containing protein [Paenibacillus aceris]MBP1963427.1 ABC-2 type transport system ATP-binding protein [Paenibacillus aceris]NHW36697.1 ATP-binding cassette domain-containing protein [Paenibacillus aceris]